MGIKKDITFKSRSIVLYCIILYGTYLAKDCGGQWSYFKSLVAATQRLSFTFLMILDKFIKLCSSPQNNDTPHFTSPHFTSPQNKTTHHTSPQNNATHHTTLHFTTLHFTTLHFTAFRFEIHRFW